jgi:hypothetical protein
MVITEFDAGDPAATLHALADEILKYRRAVCIVLLNSQCEEVPMK